jgi:hypothetical protein
LFLYGLFFSPKKIKSLLAGITSLPLLKRWHRKAIKLEMILFWLPKQLKESHGGFTLAQCGQLAWLGYLGF